eukprot:TRINITY_DN1434_c0_g1_i4.p1 TRINITY_DN1434_c0_g1~~TRINITY_DN1434_c0_g1_i4.p1  ORF type:complete len:1076 (+),score=202.61 TRINITY_DN1434_c0_g1_i4:227-3454(+)
MATLIVPINAPRARLPSVVEEPRALAALVAQHEAICAASPSPPSSPRHSRSPSLSHTPPPLPSAVPLPTHPPSPPMERAPSRLTRFLQQATSLLPSGGDHATSSPAVVSSPSAAHTPAHLSAQTTGPRPPPPPTLSLPNLTDSPTSGIASAPISARSGASLHPDVALPRTASTHSRARGYSRRGSSVSQSGYNQGYSAQGRLSVANVDFAAARRRASAVSSAFVTEIESLAYAPSLGMGASFNNGIHSTLGSVAHSGSMAFSHQQQQQQHLSPGASHSIGASGALHSPWAARILHHLAVHGAKYIRPLNGGVTLISPQQQQQQSQQQQRHRPSAISSVSHPADAASQLSSQQQSLQSQMNQIHNQQQSRTKRSILETPLLVGAAVCSVYALILAFSVYAALFYTLGSMTAAVLWAVTVLGLILSLLMLYTLQSYTAFVIMAQLAIDIPVFLGIIFANVLLSLWMVPAVLFTATFSERKGEWFTSFHLALLSLAYALIHQDLVPENGLDFGEKGVAAFCLFTLAFLLLLTGSLVRFMYHQTNMQKTDLQKAYYHLKLQNKILQSELRELRNLQTEEVIGTPAEKVIHILRSFLSDSKALSDVQQADLNLVIRLIASNKLYNSSVAYSNLKGTDGVDAETQKWVLDQLVQKTIEDEQEENEEEIAIQPANEEQNVEPVDKQVARVNSKGEYRGSKRISLAADVKRGSNKISLFENMSDRLNTLLEAADSWNFDVIEFHQETNGHSLFVMAYHIFQKYDFITEYNIDEEVLKRFLSTIEDGYVNNPYHNSLHATDVLQSFHSLICNGGLIQLLEPIEVFACLLASIIHDYKHPGVNNNYLVGVEDPLSIAFNDISVLENYHVSESFKLMSSESFNILQHVPKESKKRIRKLIIDLVLSTDMSKHADIMGALKNSLSVGELAGISADSRMLLMKMGMKLSDVSNPAKIPHVALEWTRRISDEFYSQGDKEREKMIPISPFMDRNAPVVSKSQVGFISFVVMPLAELWNSALGTGHDCLHNLSTNLDYWKARAEEEMAAQQNTLTIPSSVPSNRPGSAVPPEPPKSPNPMSHPNIRAAES